jgi:peptidoglycan/LPS O-acetylase OafA/YrhL
LKPIPKLFESGRIPSLDGLRAISVYMVIASHLLMGNDFYSTNKMPWFEWLVVGLTNSSVGVSIFFVISGFLITGLMLKELNATGRINFKNFYIRRIIRILPAAYFVILFILLMWSLDVVQVKWVDIFSASFFYYNYADTSGSWWLGHFWSLSVEEQFYLFWPCVVGVLNRNKAVFIAIGIIISGPLIRHASIVLLPDLSGNTPIMFHTRMDMLMFGCTAAILYENEFFSKICRMFFKFKMHILACVYLIFFHQMFQSMSPPLFALVGYSFEGASIVLIMIWLIQNSGTRVGKIFNSKIAVMIGVRSYSIYLWQQIFLNPYDDTFGLIFPLNIVAIIVAAEISYQLVERNFSKLRSRFLN